MYIAPTDYKVSVSVIPVLGGVVGFGAGTPASKCCNKLSSSVGIGLGGGVSTDGVGSNRFSKVSNWSGAPVERSQPSPSGHPTHTPVRPRCIPVKPSLVPV